MCTRQRFNVGILLYSECVNEGLFLSSAIPFRVCCAGLSLDFHVDARMVVHRSASNDAPNRTPARASAG